MENAQPSERVVNGIRRSSYPVKCTNSICPGDVILWDEDVLCGESCTQGALGQRTITAGVAGCFGFDENNHPTDETVYRLIVFASYGCQAIPGLTTIYRRHRDWGRYGVSRREYPARAEFDHFEREMGRGVPRKRRRPR